MIFSYDLRLVIVANRAALGGVLNGLQSDARNLAVQVSCVGVGLPTACICEALVLA